MAELERLQNGGIAEALPTVTAPSTALRHQATEDLCVVFLIQCPFHHHHHHHHVHEGLGTFPVP
jgi:hypothetical protein